MKKIKIKINITHSGYLSLLIILAYFLSGSASFSNNDPVVAKFGESQITLGEYRIAYLQLIKNPRVFDSKELRENFLDQMIQQRLLSDEAKKMGLDKNELVEYKLNSFRNKCLREEHFEKVIKPKVQISEKDIEEAYLYTQEERRVSHLFCTRKSTADSLYKQLQSGDSFEDLAKIVFTDTALSNHGGDLGWVSWDQFEYDLAMAAFRLPVNKYSLPIKSSYGYHILKVTDYRKRPMISRREYELHRRKAKYLLEYKLGDKLAYEYIGKMLKKSKIKIYPAIVHAIELKLVDKFKRKPGQYDQMFDVQLKDEEIKIVETNLWDERHAVVTIINGKNLTIGDFIGYLNFVPYKIFSGGMKQTLDCIIRDYLLTQEAKRMNLTNTEKVNLKTKIYSDNLLQIEMRKMLIQGVQVNEDELEQYYKKYKAKFKDESFDNIHNYVKGLYMDEKRSKVVPEYVNQLKQHIKIEKNLDVIHKYYDSVINKEDF